MLRKPAKSDATPRCFGLSHQASDRTCRRCPVAERCRRVCAKWIDRLSIREHLVAAEHELDATTGMANEYDVATLYMRLARKYLNRNFNRKAERYLREGRGRDYLLKLKVICESEDLDIVTWIAANMVRQREWASRTKFGFQPNMLLGDRARGNYNAHIRKHARRSKSGIEEFADDASDMRKLITVLVEDETAVAEDFVASYLADGIAVWDDSAENIPVGKEWKQHRGSAKLWRVVRLQAAVNVLSQYDPRYPDILGLREFTWVGIASALGKLVPALDRQETPACGDVPVLHWRGNVEREATHL